MPQEFHVIRCYSCLIFQVHQVKKKPRWQCKICSEKQSVKKVYGKGSGKECRLLVQSLNMTIGQKASEDPSGTSTDHPAFLHLPHPLDEGAEGRAREIHEDDVEIDQAHALSSKWNRFCEEEPETSSHQDPKDELRIGIPSELITTERPAPLKRKKGQSNFTRASSKWSRFDECINEEIFAESAIPQKNQSLSRPFHDLTDTPRWDNNSLMRPVGRGTKNDHSVNVRPTCFSSYDTNDTTHHYEQYNPTEMIHNHSQNADGTISRPQVDGDKFFVNDSKSNYRQDYNKIAPNKSKECTKSLYESTKTNDWGKTRASTTVVAPNSKWAVFANPDSDDEGEDSGKGSNNEFEVLLDRENNCIPDLCSGIDAFEEYPTDNQASDTNDSGAKKASSQEGDAIHLKYNNENRSCERENFGQCLGSMNVLPDLYPPPKAGVKKSSQHASARIQENNVLNSIQNPLRSNSDYRSRKELQAKETVKNFKSVSSATNDMISHHHIDKKTANPILSFQVAEDVLEDLPDDFDVW